MGGVQQFTVRSGQPEQAVDFGAGGTVTVVGGTVYYRDEPGVTATSADGSIADGGSITLLGTQFFSTTASRVDGLVRLPDLVGGSSVPKIVGNVGHSYGQGIGADTDASGNFELFARGLGAERFFQRAVNGAIACWAADGSVGQGNGGWAHALNAIHPGSAIENIPPFAGSSTGLANGYGPRSTIEVVYYGINDLSQLGSTALRPFQEAMRSIMSCAVAAKTIRATNTTYLTTTTGTWANITAVRATVGGGGRRATAAASVASLAVPSDLPAGRVVAFQFHVLPGDDYVVTFKQNGTTVATKTVQGAAIVDPNHTAATNPGNAYVVRLGMAGDGITIAPSDTITATLTTLTAGGMEVLAVNFEADPLDGPLLVLPLANTLASYSVYNASPHGPLAGTDPMNNAAIGVLNTTITGLAAEFPSRSLPVAVDSILGASDISSDGVHPKNSGHSKIASALIAAVRSSGLLTPRVCSAATGLAIPYWLPMNITHIAAGGFPSSIQLQTGWSAFDSPSVYTTGAVGGDVGHMPYLGYRRDERGMVQLRGRVVPAGTGQGITGGVLCALPRGFGPEIITELPLVDANGALAVAEISPYRSASSPTTATITMKFTGTPAWISLDGIRYLAGS